MGQIMLDTEDWPDWMKEAVIKRAEMHGISPGAFLAEIITAFVEKREPEFNKEKQCKQL